MIPILKIHYRIQNTFWGKLLEKHFLVVCLGVLFWFGFDLVRFGLTGSRLQGIDDDMSIIV